MRGAGPAKGWLLPLHDSLESMGLCYARGGGWAAGLGGVPLARAPWRRVWLCLHGNGGGGGGGGGGGAVSWQRRRKSTDPLAVARQYQQWRKEEEELLGRRHKSLAAYLLAAVAGMVGLSYASVPLYRLFCQVSGFGGTIRTDQNSEKIETMKPIRDRVIKVTFNADVHATLSWNFRPQQTEIYVVPGETALAFYKAKNPTDKPIIGISTYNVVPFEAGPYFNKIQCFCFEEQRLNPHEEVDMPVFFYIDPAFDEDPMLMNVNLITLSYTFFESKTGAKLPLPGYMQQNTI